MAIDQLQLAAWRESLAQDRAKVEEYREEFERAKTAAEKLRLRKLVELFEHKAESMADFIRNRIRADRTETEYAKQAAEAREKNGRTGPASRELTQAEIDRMTDAEFEEFCGKPVTRSTLSDEFGALVAELRAAKAAEQEENELARQWAEIRAAQYKPAITISRRGGY